MTALCGMLGRLLDPWSEVFRLTAEVNRRTRVEQELRAQMHQDYVDRMALIVRMSHDYDQVVSQLMNAEARAEAARQVSTQAMLGGW